MIEGEPHPTTGQVLAQFAHLINQFGPNSLHVKAFQQDERWKNNREVQDLMGLSLKLHHAIYGSASSEIVPDASQPDASLPRYPEEQLADRVATSKLRLAAEEVLLTVPEVRTVLCVVDYRGPINDLPDFLSAAWVGDGPGGTVTDPAAMIGTAYNTMRTLRHVVDRIEQYVQALEKDAINVSKQILAAKSGDPSGSPQPPAPGASG